jgi:multiple sugar transport system ATP-binding protein
MAQIRCVNLSKSYGSVEVIPDFNLDVAEHEFVVFLGPSGCGKSTMLRMIAGLEDISGGTLLIDGRIVNDLPPRERNIAMVFQNYALYPHMSVFDNIAFGLRRMRIGRADIARRVAAVAATLGLETLLERRPAQLSGGQQQRVAIARAMIKTPRVFLFDEPLSNLDAKLRGHMRIEIARLHKQLKTTTIYVTHDQIEAMTLADRIVVLRNGLVEQIGSPAEIYQRPRTLFVAGFIGPPNMNLIDVTVADGGDRWILSSRTSDFTVPRACFDLAAGTKAVLGIRPPDMTIIESGQPGNVIEGTVELVEFLGNEVLINLTLLGAGNGGQSITVLAAPPGPVPGAILRVALDEQRLHLFDAESGMSLLNEASYSPANLSSSAPSAYARAV